MIIYGEKLEKTSLAPVTRLMIIYGRAPPPRRTVLGEILSKK
jgi:hypothetical protein